MGKLKVYNFNVDMLAGSEEEKKLFTVPKGKKIKIRKFWYSGTGTRASIIWHIRANGKRILPDVGDDFMLHFNPRMLDVDIELYPDTKVSIYYKNPTTNWYQVQLAFIVEEID